MGVRYQIFWGQLAWVVIVVWAMGFTVVTRYLPAASEKDYPDDRTRGATVQAEAATESLLENSDVNENHVRQA